MPDTDADARATLRHAIISGLIKRCRETGVQAGPSADKIIADVLESITAPEFRWALEQLGRSPNAPGTAGG